MRHLTKIEGPEPVADEEKLKSLGWSRTYYDQINNIWHNIVKDAIDREFGSTAKLKSFGWFKCANQFTLDKLEKQFPPLVHEGKKYSPFAEKVGDIYKYHAFYIETGIGIVRYCNHGDTDEGEPHIEVTFTLDDLPKEYKMVLDRAGTRRKIQNNEFTVKFSSYIFVYKAP